MRENVVRENQVRERERKKERKCQVCKDASPYKRINLVRRENQVRERK